MSPDGRRILVEQWGRGFVVLDAATRKIYFTVKAPWSNVPPLHGLSCTFTPDGRWIVSAGMDRAIRVWDATGVCVAAIHGAFWFNAVAAADGVVCAGDDAGNLWIVDGWW